jgi:hypothetical protein
MEAWSAFFHLVLSNIAYLTYFHMKKSTLQKTKKSKIGKKRFFEINIIYFYKMITYLFSPII